MAKSPRPSSSKVKKKDTDDYVPRPYQLELLDAAIEENTIVNLGTGAGKTFIAVMLIKELSFQILKPFGEEDAKRSVFLVTTVPLVKQQAQYVAMHTGLVVGEYTGSLGVDAWSREKWHHEFNEHQVLVMTMTIFKNLLLTAYIKLSQVNLLIFDECHHAVKNHDYVVIMRMFKKHIENNDMEVPRVLGLTASLIPSKCKPGDLEPKIEELEQILCCRSQTAGDLQEVTKYATNPNESTLQYRSTLSDRRMSELKILLETPVSFLDRFKRDQKTKIYEIVKLYLEDCLHLFLNLGLWCAHEFAMTGLHCIEEEIADIGGHYDSEWDMSLIYFGRTQLQIFAHKSFEVLSHSDFQKEIPLTPKVKSLFLHLGDSAISSGEVEVSNGSTSNKGSTNKLLGIVFVERRTTAVTLCNLLRKKKEEDPDLKHIRCAYVVGHNDGKGGNFLRRDAKMKVKEQNKVLDMFRQEKFNLLIATSVLEEGLDVPKCNTVIRFDFPPNFRSYLQSKGRARAKISTYLLFIDEEEAGKKFADLRDYRALEESLQLICRGRHVPEDEAILKRMEELVEPFMPFGMDGPKALLSSSLSLVHKYCQKLPKDRYTILAPEFKPEERSVAEVIDECIFDPRELGVEKAYQCTLTLPKSCPWKEPIKGQWMPTRRIADKSAALEAVKKLHEVGELNEHLLPVSKSDDSDAEDELKMEARKVKTAGTEKRSNYYPNKVAPALTDCFPVAGPGNHLYVLLMKEVGTNKIYQSLPNEAANPALGIMTRKPLSHLKIPGFSLYDEDKELHVEVVKYHNIVGDLSDSELEELKCCHRILFTEVLCIRPTWLEAQFETADKNYLIVPLRILPDLDPLEVFIDTTLVKQVIETERMSHTTSWRCRLDQFENALVETLHRKEMQQLCEVRKVYPSITPQSPFPDPSVAPTYASYFEKKYNFHFNDMSQPALECKALGLKERRIQLLTSRYKNADGESFAKSTQKSKPVNLFPEQCVLHPVCANFWKLVRCLPSALWRVECSLVADTLRSKIVAETQIGLLGDNSQITTCTNLRGYEDYGFGELTTQKFTTNHNGEEEVHTIDAPDFSVLPLRGPDNALCLQALTPKGATDSINLERLEILGDSFLKLATSVFLYCDRPLAHEGKLTMARSRRIGNLNLYLLAIKHSITDAIFSTTFEPRQMWIPPCFIFNQDDPHLTTTRKAESVTPPEEPEISSEQQRHYLYHKLTDKGVADCVESLIGAYLVSGGIDAALKFMKWMEIKITHDKATEGSNSASMSSTESGEASSHSSSSIPPMTKRPKIAGGTVPLFVQNSSTIFSENFEAPKTTSKQVEVERLLSVSFGAMKLEIKWEFRDRSLLLEALTHASYTKNRVTECFQRLEFLGDAVLDYLVTCHIYSTFPRFDPGRISGMRSALVNNITFAELSVQMGLHKALLHNSPALFKHVEEYMESIERMNSTGAYNEATDTEIFCFDQNEDSSDSEMDTTTPSPSAPMSDENDGNTDDDDVIEIDPPKVLGDILESLAGAIFLDSGMNLESVWEVFRPLFDKKIRSFNEEIPVSPIHKLYEKEPDVKVERQRSVRGNYRCTITVVNKNIKVSATSNTKKGAKHAAAKAVLEKLNKRI